MSGKNPPVLKASTPGGGRRSARRRGQGQDPVVAPGFGTKQDIEKLTQDLSTGGDAKLPSEAVEAMMNSRGRGIQSPNPKDPNGADSKPGATSSAWADFMKEEGVDLAAAASAPAATATASAPAAATTALASNDNEKKKAATKKKSSGGSKRKSYNLQPLEDITCQPSASKKAKLSGGGGGALLQSGTLDVSAIGRKGLSKELPTYQLMCPTRILPGVGITKVFTSCNACHYIALDVSGQVYGWGRNDAGQLTKDMAANVAVPTLLSSESSGLADVTIISAAVGKTHSLVLTDDGKVFAVGSNKMGQCGIKSATENVTQFKPCVFAPNVKIAQIACGEFFSVALSDQGQIYTTGSSEYGQLGNGETGEYFVTASKLAFANCNVFTVRTQFMERDPGQEFSSSSAGEKLLPIREDLRFQSIACGKNHTVAVEANYNEGDDDDDDGDSSANRLRVFSWGCGNYGVLGHGIQSDEYFPRDIAALGQGIWLPPGPLSAEAGSSVCLLKTSNGQVYYWGKHKTGGEAVMRPQLVDALANNFHIVSQCAAGAQTVVCCTEGAQTVAWGQGPHGELGLGIAKSSAAPKFVESLTACRIQSLACAYGTTLYVVKDDDAEDKAAIAKLPLLDENAKADLEFVWANAPKPKPVGGFGKGKKKKR